MPDRNPSAARRIDAETLKAFSHPLRMRLYDRLKDHGPATASMLGRAVGQSSGQTSYHLRQLERHGLVAEETGRGTARERWWRAEGFSFGPDVAADDESLSAVRVALQHWAGAAAAHVVDWAARQPDEEREWVEAAANDETTIAMTPQELAETRAAMQAALHEQLERVRARRCEGGDTGTRTVKVYLNAFPLPREE